MLVRFVDKLDKYHQRRADEHGALWWVVRRDRIVGSIYEARSIATGVVCTLDADYTEESPDGPKL